MSIDELDSPSPGKRGMTKSRSMEITPKRSQAAGPLTRSRALSQSDRNLAADK